MGGKVESPKDKLRAEKWRNVLSVKTRKSQKSALYFWYLHVQVEPGVFGQVGLSYGLKRKNPKLLEADLYALCFARVVLGRNACYIDKKTPA